MSMVVDFPTTRERMSKIYLDIIDVSLWLGKFVTGFIQLMITKYMGVGRNQVENLIIEDDLSFSRYTLPFFATPPETDKTGSSTADFP